LETNINDTGKLYVEQIITSHNIKVATNKEKAYTFNSQEVLNDTPPYKDGTFREHYKEFCVKQGVINGSYGNKLIFEDSPERQLLDYWTEFEYYIEFETWIQFDNGQSIIPLVSFNWWLDCKAKRNNSGVWKICSSNYSKEDEIQFKNKSVNDTPLDTKGLCQVSKVTEQFYENIHYSEKRKK
jgi:hypothetical protein